MDMVTLARTALMRLKGVPMAGTFEGKVAQLAAALIEAQKCVDTSGPVVAGNCQDRIAAPPLLTARYEPPYIDPY